MVAQALPCLPGAGAIWVFAYLFAKKDRNNITAAELTAFRDLAALYDHKTDRDIDLETKAGELTEICNG